MCMCVKLSGSPVTSSLFRGGVGHSLPPPLEDDL